MVWTPGPSPCSSTRETSSIPLNPSAFTVRQPDQRGLDRDAGGLRPLCLSQPHHGHAQPHFKSLSRKHARRGRFCVRPLRQPARQQCRSTSSDRLVSLPVSLLDASGDNAENFLQIVAEPGSQGGYVLTSNFGLPAAPAPGVTGPVRADRVLALGNRRACRHGDPPAQGGSTGSWPRSRGRSRSG